MEFMMLIFMGMAYTIFSNNFSSLMLYFLVQTISSFRIFLFYLYPNPVFFTLSLFLKLSMFPFHFWFLNVCYRFPNFVLFLSSSVHKLPIFLIILFFSPFMSNSFALVSAVSTVFLSGCIMLSSSDFRSILLSSSVGNNS
jgi:NADH:ubiquinone oxidoreductase subunit 2 (subunit N)